MWTGYLLVDASILNISELDAPPPGGGFTIATVATPGLETSSALIWTSSHGWQYPGLGQTPGPLTAVGRGEPFQKTVDPSMKLFPNTLSWKPGEPAEMTFG